MIRFIILLFALVLFQFNNGLKANDSLFNELENSISQREKFLNIKLARIESYSNELSNPQINKRSDRYFKLNELLFQEYQSFVYDSAFKYAIILKNISDNQNDKQNQASAKLKLGFVLLSSGLFKEAIDTLKSIEHNVASDSFKAILYSTIARSYYDLADYDRDNFYSVKYQKWGNIYMDTALLYVKKGSSEYWSFESLRLMKCKDYIGAQKAFEHMIYKLKLTDHQYAIAFSSLGYIYTLLGKDDQAIDMLAKAAIADIKSSVKETVALRNLSDLIYKKGDVKTAYRYIKLALEDATFYNARHRKIEIASILPIIEGEKLNTVEKQKTLLLAYSGLISILTIIVIVFLIIIFRQLKRLKQARQMILDANSSLTETNHKLLEANKIKETYIGIFFNTNSEFIDKIEKLQRDISRKLTTNQIDDIKSILKNIELKKERESLYHTFDKVFLKLFPDFVQEFNKLFNEEDRIELKDKELLNTDLRIFALIRIGIDDNEKIAKILEYSVNTIYTYKTKIKNKSIVANEEFENHVMAIKAI